MANPFPGEQPIYLSNQACVNLQYHIYRSSYAKLQAFQTAQFQCILSRDSLLISYELSPIEEVRWRNRTHRSAVWKPVINQKVVVQNHIAKL